RGVLLAAARVTRGAPQLRALYDTDGAPRPFDAPALPILQEVGRVDDLADVLRPDLLRLVDEEILDPWLLTNVVDLFDDQRSEPAATGTTTTICLDAVLSGTVDHGLARWLGFLDNDVLPIADDSKIAARIVTAVFAPDWSALLQSGLVLSLPPAAVVA